MALLGVAVGYLPLLGTREGLPPVAAAAAVAVLAVVSAAAQPLAGRVRDRVRLPVRLGVPVAQLVGAASLLLMLWSNPAAV